MSPDDRIVITRRHDDLTATDLTSLAALFDAEYRASFGPWTPERPYGYAGHDVHIWRAGAVESSDMPVSSGDGSPSGLGN